MESYIIELSLCWLAFYLIYIIFLSKETFFVVNRFYLLSTLVISFFIPVITIPTSSNEVLPIIVEPINIEALIIASQPVIEERKFDFTFLFWIVYGIGVLYMLCKFLVGLLQIKRIYDSGRKVIAKGYFLIRSELEHMPFSFMYYLFFSEKNKIPDVEKQQIIQHEKAHIQQWHTFDILLLEFLQIVFWFNPLIFFYKKSIKENHEYLADKAALKNTSKKIYGRLLLEQAHPGIGLALANNFNYSQIKKRILMMTRKKSKRQDGLRYLAAFPVVIVLILLFANRINSQSHDYGQETVNITDDLIITSDSLKNVFTIVEKMPTFGTCNHISDMKSRKKCSDEGILDFMSRNIKYPETARKNDIQGIAVVSFVIDKNGYVNNAKIVRSINKACDEEALRVVNSMPRWNPGEQRGEKVNVKFNLPIRFRLSEAQIKHTIPAPPLPNEARPLVSSLEGETYKIVEQMPVFGNCDNRGKEAQQECSNRSVLEYLSFNIKYPARAQKDGKEGVVIVSLIIDKLGNVSNVEITQKGDPEMDAEVLRVVRNMPKWKPGKQKGENVNVQHYLPVRFNLREDEQSPSLNRKLVVKNYKIDPNPTTGSFNLRFSLDKKEGIEIRVFDMIGQKHYFEKVTSFSGAYSKRLNLENLPAGPYYIQIKQGELMQTNKFVIK